jgi:hypothetical protein
VDTANRIVYLTGPTGISQSNASEEGFITGNRYLVDNVQDALTQAGQWFLDRSPWTLTYLANAGENPNTDTVVIPQLPQVLVASNLQICDLRGLTFEHDNYPLPATGHVSSELGIGAAVSFQNSQHITFDGGTVTETSGSGLEFVPCINGNSPAYCVATTINAVVSNNLIENSAFYDIGVLGIRIGNQYQPADTDANVPQSTTVQNNVVEGYGRLIPASFGIGQGMGHDNRYTHNDYTRNDLYDGYHCAIFAEHRQHERAVRHRERQQRDLLQSRLQPAGDHERRRVHTDRRGNSVFAAAGNKLLNNKIHDVSDASALDANGYGGNGIHMDDNTGLVDVENNLVYRVSGADVYTPHGPAAPSQANIIKNNLLAYGRLGMVSVSSPFGQGVPPTVAQVFKVTGNLFYFDRSTDSTPPFRVQNGCSYSGVRYPSFQQFSSNLYWRTDGGFAGDAKAFHLQPSPGPGPNAPCSDDKSTWTFCTFSGW